MKAILILEEMPSCCNDCPCFDGMEYGCCNYLRKDIEDILIIDKDCPLKLLPQHKGAVIISEKASPIEFNGRICYANGWNDCLDEILGEENETD